MIFVSSFQREDYFIHFYRVLEAATLRMVEPNMALTLTGGLDTRVLLGILWKNHIQVPTITHYSFLQNVVAAKIAEIVGFEHYLFNDWNKLPFDSVMSAGFFDEIAGSWMGFKAKTEQQFKDAVKCAMRDRNNYVRKHERSYKLLFPLLDESVQTVWKQIPFRWKIGKQLQFWILQNLFEKLALVPYANSFLLNLNLPYPFHAVPMLFVSELKRRGLPLDRII